MSGYYLTLLVRAADVDEAKSMAESAIDDWFESGYLHIGDRGHIAEDEPILCGADDPVAFMAALRASQEARRNQIQYYQSRLDHYMHDCGIASVQDVKLEEESVGDMSMVGYFLKKMGKLIGREFDPDCVFYNTESYNGGLSPDEMAEIEAEPAEWALVTVVVG